MSENRPYNSGRIDLPHPSSPLLPGCRRLAGLSRSKKAATEVITGGRATTAFSAIQSI